MNTGCLNNNHAVYLQTVILVVVALTLMVTFVSAQQSDNENVQAKENVSDYLSRKQKLGNKLRLIDILIKRSHTLKQARSESGTQSSSQFHEAEQARDVALKSIVAGDLEKAEREIDYALRILSSASAGDKKEDDDPEYINKYRDVSERLDSFRKSLIMICKEKNISLDSVLDSAAYLLLMNDADALKEKSNYKRAVLKLEKASSMLEVALSNIRSNETLVHKLEFANIDEEYAYELERHKSHILLMELMLTQRSYPQSVEKKIINMKNNSMLLLKQSQSEYQSNNKQKAKKTLEKGVDELIKAMRLGGMYTY